MMYYDILLFSTVLFCTTTWSLKLPKNVSMEVSNLNKTQNNSKLLHGIIIYLQCLRLYSEINQNGYWSDICDSNELLSPYLMMTTQSICAPANVWYKTPRYWLAYQQPYYSGSYILLKPGQCVKNVRAYGLLSIGSILQCAQIALFGYLPTLNCYYPQQPWRQLASLSPMPPVMPLTPTLIVTQQTMPQLKTGTVSLLDLQKSSLNIT
ncbi:unnamed protein product [Schistosoma guineensis]|nr:unnamed protein product [Schistosoma guineensis]